ncbi:MAG TPA: alpha/beta fold hydrolase [Actinophytocola sp.]|uniref:thioesterase II family protein n=1 Tax=Actinophytocola sp. TaxID=1872138 RepID=UPI002DB8B65B|nr:alpha/beta fold hydrolase [Actinophytocola sp.]HEU5470753.1 alpha/beta fold hydrolase [Actinophytocola sp.]
MLSTADQTDLWVRRYHPAPHARSRLLCLPHAGGSATYFFGVSRALSPRVEVLAVQYPGRQDRRSEPFVETIGELADRVVGAIGSQLDDRPLALFGHSMGAVLAFEVATRLERTGTVAAALFVSGRRAPCTHRAETVHLKDDNGILDEVRSLNGTDSRIMADDELIRMALPSIRADYKAIETYRYEPAPPLRSPIQAMVGDEDPKASIPEVRRWAEHTSAGFTLHVFPGGHFFLDQHVTAVLDKITGGLPG